MYRLFLFLLFILPLNAGTSLNPMPSRRGIPFHQTFTQDDYPGGPQNWAITQDSRGIMYFGNSYGILEFDGVNWRMISTPPGTDVYALATDSFGFVYAGLFNNFGMVVAGKHGIPVYKSLSDSIHIKFGQIFNIIRQNDFIYFFSNHHLFRFDGHKVDEPFHNHGFYFLGKQKNVLFLQENKEPYSVYTLSDTTLQKLEGFQNIQAGILKILPLKKNTFLIVTYAGQFFLYKNKIIKEIKTNFDALFQNGNITQIISLGNDLYALIIDPYGVVIMNGEGKHIYSIDIASNLLPDTPLSLFKDQQNNLWVGTNSGISRYEVSSAYSALFANTGIRGAITDIERFDDDLYISTLGRFYRIKLNMPEKMKFSPNFKKRFAIYEEPGAWGWNWDMLRRKDQLLIAGEKGLMVIDKTHKFSIELPDNYLMALAPSNIYPNRVYALSMDSLIVLKKKSNHWKKDFVMPVKISGGYKIFEAKDNSVWFDSYEHGIFRLKLNNNGKPVTLINYTQKDGLPKDNFNFLLPIDGKPNFFTVNGLYTFNENNVIHFSKDSLSELGKIAARRIITNTFSDYRNHYYFSTRDSLIVFQKQKDGTMLRDDTTLARIINEPVETMWFDPNGITWIGGSKGLILYNPRYQIPVKNKYHTFIRSIQFAHKPFFSGFIQKSRLKTFIPLKEGYNPYHSIPFKKNIVTFSYTINSYNNLIANEYQYWLEGFEKNWSAWSKATTKEYSFLPPGKYIFHTRGRNADHFIAEDTSFPFEIIPPWYQTKLAIIGYVLALLLLTYGIVKFRSLGLERQVALRTRELTLSNKRLVEAKAEAEQATQSKSLFLANMSHEIRTPLNGVLGMNQLLKTTNPTPEQLEYIEAIRISGDSLLTIINDILDFSKIEAGSLKLENIPFNLPNLMRQTFDIVKIQGEKKGLEMRMDIPDNFPEIILGDPTRLRQILLNFCNNAVKFTEKGYVHLKISTLFPANKKCKQGSIPVRFSVKDSGIGIPRSKQKHIFESFAQADATTTRRFGGTGLGLAISKLLAELMGGQVGLDSAPDKGSTFWLSLCVTPAQKAIQKQEEPKEISSVKPIRKNIRILLAEDNIINQKLMMRILKKYELNFDVVENGREALDKLKEKHYDLILMDIQMPVMDGFTATQEIRRMEDSTQEHIPIIALTANAVKGDRERCLDAGMDDYLAKPINVQELLSIIERYTS